MKIKMTAITRSCQLHFSFMCIDGSGHTVVKISTAARDAPTMQMLFLFAAGQDRQYLTPTLDERKKDQR